MIRRRSFLLAMVSASALMACQHGVAGASSEFGTRPLFVTGDGEDPLFTDPYIDVEEWRDAPAVTPDPFGFTTQASGPPPYQVRHLYVHGGFRGTDTRFSFCFPQPEQYQGRFYQPTHQLLTSENTQPRNVAMAIAAGAYVVQTNMGGSAMARSAESAASAADDGSIGSYRANAAAAKYSRVVAQRIYGREHRPFGYLYGGSGGAFQTTAAAQNTEGVWDGFVPMVMAHHGVSTAGLLARARAVTMLKDKWPAVIDAFEPGGGDPYASLNAEQRNALEEATLFGFPPRAWANYANEGTGPLGFMMAQISLRDPAYLDDFWTQPGYIVEPTSVRTSRIQQEVTIVNVIQGPPTRSQFMVSTQVELSDIPSADLLNANLLALSGEAAGRSAPLGAIDGKIASFALGANPEVVSRFRAGDRMRIDNSDYLALQTYYRHALPARGSFWDFPQTFDSFRNSDGGAKFQQRGINVSMGPAFGLDGVPPGSIRGKMIAIECLSDGDAFPWQAAWYKEKVQAALGARFDDNYRLYYQEYAEHTPPRTREKQRHVVSYAGALEQTLRDLAAWVERGVAPPDSTPHQVVRGQVQIPPDAASRKGIQSVVDLKANGAVSTQVRVAQPVTFTATIEMPPDTGPIVAADWDFEGTGAYSDAGALSASGSPSVTVTATHTYAQPGTYFAAIRASANRDGDNVTPFARVQNLGRVRVVVS